VSGCTRLAFLALFFKAKNVCTVFLSATRHPQICLWTVASEHLSLRPSLRVNTWHLRNTEDGYRKRPHGRGTRCQIMDHRALLLLPPLNALNSLWKKWIRNQWACELRVAQPTQEQVLCLCYSRILRIYEEINALLIIFSYLFYRCILSCIAH